MKVGQRELELLSQVILKNLKEEFEFKHLSGNLINTIVIENMENEIKIRIPAQTYNMLEYKRSKVIIHTTHGSYASKLDKEGSSFMVYLNESRKGSKRISPRNHIGYIDNVINKSIAEWKGMISGEVVSTEG